MCIHPGREGGERVIHESQWYPQTKKPIVDTHTHTQRNPNITLNIVIRSHKGRQQKEKEQKRPTKIIPKQWAKCQ